LRSTWRRSVVVVTDAQRRGYRDNARSIFTTWIKQQGIPPYGESDESRLASGPSSQITSWQGYDINGYRFHTKEKDKKSAS